MTRPDAIEALRDVSRSFGPEPARQKVRLLDEIPTLSRPSARGLLALHETLSFLRAWPDDRQVHRRVESAFGRLREWIETSPDRLRSERLADTGLPGSENHYPYSYAVLQRLARLCPDCLDVEWDDLEDQYAIHNVLVMLVTNGECQGLDDIRLTMPEWLDGSRADANESDIEFLLRLFERSSLGFEEQAYFFESCALPIRYRLAAPGTGRNESTWPVERIHYQRKPIPRQAVALDREIRRPFPSLAPLDRAAGRRLLDLSLLVLCSRNLEIRPLMYADPRDVTVLDCGRALQVVLTGGIPEYRDAHETSWFCLILKNGVPIAYGPASVCLGCCEMGINLFPEFRGGEVRWIYAQYMRALHQALGARYFYLTSYGMGEGNPEAIRSGAFWFYRKLGFVPTNPDVEELARSEDAKMRSDPRHRSDVRTLRRMSKTEVYFDLSAGTCQRLDLGALGMRQSRFVAREFGGDRPEAERSCARRAARLLGCGPLSKWSPGEQRALRILAPTFCMIEGLSRWPPKDREQLVKLVRTKGGRSEARADPLAFGHRRFREALRRLATAEGP